ncbi:hypothetical protein AB0H12_41015 [Actinosynnema sp. NPDC023794]
MVKFAAWVVLAWVGLATAMWTAPVSMTHVGGDVPAQDSFEHPCAFDEAGMKNCSDTSYYLWRLSGERAVTTTWEPGREDIGTITGTLVHEHTDCPDSRVEWTVVAGDRTSGTLTAENPTADLDIEVRQPLRELTLTVRRLDGATCAAALRWSDPRLEPPFKLLP